MKKQRWYSRASRSSSPAPATPRAAFPADVDAAANGLGCMSMVHYLIFAPGAGCVGRPPPSSHAGVAVVGSGSNNSHHVKPSSSSSSCNNSSKGGLEAPRNSLEMDADQLRDIQIGVQIEPAFDALLPAAGRRSTGRGATAPSSEAETPRTPSLVARLMGIDGLPDQLSPSPGFKKPGRAPSTSGIIKEDRSPAVKEKKKRVILESMNKEQQVGRQPLRSLSCNVGAVGEARSLPDTPRASASSARTAAPTWDVVDRPRLSLQVLRENVLDRAAQYMSMPTSPTSSSPCDAKTKKKKKDGHRRRDAKEHAREILRQAKETVTNRNKSGGKKPPPASTGSSIDKENAPPFLVEDKLVVLQVQAPAAPAKLTAPPPPLKKQADQQPHAPRLPPPQRTKPSRPPPPPPLPDHPAPSRAVASPQAAVKSKRPPDGCERFATRIKKPAAAAGAAATIHQAAAPSAPPLPSTTAAPASTSVDHRRNHSAAAPTTSTSSSPVPLEEDPEYRYLRTVLERGGFMRTTPPPAPHRPFKGHSVSSPVDPIVFHLLEIELPADAEPQLGPLRHRWNRKLLFHLTQEILADLLLDGEGLLLHGAPLLGKVWGRVKAFPAADCRVVGDIDALVAADLSGGGARSGRRGGLAHHPAVAEEASDVADDVAERLLDALLGECCHGWSPSPPPPAAVTCIEVAVATVTRG